jgi:hypothetical protein
MVAIQQAVFTSLPDYPIFWNVTSEESVDLSKKRLAGWQSFTVILVENQTVPSLLWTEREQERHTPPLQTGTGPSDSTLLPVALDATQDRGDGLAALEVAAEVGNERAFARVAAEIDWLQRSAAEYARAVRLALATEAHLLARELADEGAKRYPDSQELQKMAHILAPPRVVRTEASIPGSLAANRAWMRLHADEYRGKWVALRNGSLLAEAESAAEVWRSLESTEGVMLTRVF